ncbi:hypothetical protein ACKVMT_02090 [Halobacteriales archaeon Cl-PHB]
MSAAHDEVAGDDEPIPDRIRRVGAALPLPVGVGIGVASTVVGYLAFFGMLVASSAVDFSRSVGAILKSVGLLYYNAHNIPLFERLVITQSQGGEVVARRIRETWVNQITGWARIHEEVRNNGQVVDEATRTTTIQTDPALPPEVYLLVPVVVLLLAGAVLALRVLEPPTRGKDTAITSLLVGAAICLGYLLVVLVGTYLLVREGGTEGSVLHPARLEALGYGLAYPLVFGSLGTYLGILWQRGDATQAPDGQSA